MPVFTTPVSSQNTASSGGVHLYPSISQSSQYNVVGDAFQRESLTPTNAYTLYTTVAASSGTASILTTAPFQLELATAAASANDYVGTRTSGLTFFRIASDPIIDPRTIMRTSIVAAFKSVTGIQTFCGFVKTFAGITALPGTTKSMGFYMDTSVDSKIYLTSSNGTSQRTLDCGTAAFSTYYKTVITQNADNSVVLQLFSGLSYGQINNLLGTLTVTDSGYDDIFSLHFWNKTLDATAKKLDVYSWANYST